MIADFWRLVCSHLERRRQAGRLKQWFNFLRRRYPGAEVAYQALKTVNDAAMIDAWMTSQAGAPGGNFKPPDRVIDFPPPAAVYARRIPCLKP